MTPDRLAAVRTALLRDMTIDIVTLGARSGEWRTTEIWYVVVDGRIYLCGTPGAGEDEREYAPRDWIANLKAHPEFRFVLKESIDETLDSRAVIVTDPDERRRVFSANVTGWYRRQTGSLEALVEHGPMVRVDLLGSAAGLDLTTAGTVPPPRGGPMTITEQIIDTETADGPMAIVHAAPEGGSPKRVLIFMDAPGIRPSLTHFAVRLAEAGYEVAIPDLWHRHGRMIGFDPVDDAEANQANRLKIMEMLGTLDDGQVLMDRDATLNALGWTDGPMATIGFCLGARYVHKAMQELPHRFPTGAMWHPSFLTDDTEASPHLSVDAIGELWIGIGTADKVQSIEMHQRYLDAIEGLDNITLRIFDGADHGYTWPVSPTYHEEAATVGWNATTEMFDRVLG